MKSWLTSFDQLFYDKLQERPIMPERSIFPDPQNDPFFDRLPALVSEQLSEEQRHAIAAALPERSRAQPPVNIRLSIPMLQWRFYFAINSGKERRNKPRLAADRRHNPLATKGNALFVLMGTMALSLFSLGGLLVYASVLQV